MSSPVTIPFKSLIQIDRSSDTAVYLQIAYQLINAIQRGVIVPGIQLPGSRILAETLDVHRKTIIAAYEELDAQGWTSIKANKGTFIAAKSAVTEADPLKYNKAFLLRYPEKTGYAFNKSMLLDLPASGNNSEFEFTDGLPDVRLAPLAQLSSVYSTNLKRKSNRRYLGYTSTDGSSYFREMLAAYLNNTRGLHITSNNVMTTRGVDMGVYLASDLLLSQGDVVVVGDLSYYVTNMIFQKAGAKIISVPVDTEGISVAAVRDLCSKQKIRMLYITPHHHYPTTVTLSAKRRLELLELSAKHGFIILEDDYDYDFHYNSSPVLPLASADGNGMVVYIGSFCKSLAPGFRSGYLVGPENLIQELSKLRGIVDRQGDVLMEQALAELLEEGEIQRHLKKALKVYHERRDAFCSLLKSTFKDLISFVAAPGGLAIWTQWNSDLNLMRISKDCAQNNLYLPQTLLYQTDRLTAMRLGFGNQTLEEMEQSVSILAGAVALQTKTP
jgi:GntR family transcriptional regulator/MocR family aminotransferase